jgi:hypothetical protein
VKRQTGVREREGGTKIKKTVTYFPVCSMTLEPITSYENGIGPSLCSSIVKSLWNKDRGEKRVLRIRFGVAQRSGLGV